MTLKNILLCSVVLTLSACSPQRIMQESSGPRYTPRPEIAHQDYTSTHHAQDRTDKKNYTQYEQREQCQQYRELPRNMVDTCGKHLEKKSKHTEQKQLPIVSTYTILFDHNKSDIRRNESETLDRAMREIAKYNPTHVTVTGYTDSSGSTDYNQALSHQREQAVSQALLARGIKNQTLERDARGEYGQAVTTQDGIKNQYNRRVVIDFRR
jgi:outer membrane protein OmpA-like peptidoglycan-associated protein